MNNSKCITSLFLLCAFIFVHTSFTIYTNEDDWGFFAHRRINRMAVFTLPKDMIKFYKKHIEYITDHAVDPDKRRYATKHEAVRHYIDIDHWGEYPFENVPRNWTDAITKYTEICLLTEDKDTLIIGGKDFCCQQGDFVTFGGAGIQQLLGQDSCTISHRKYRAFVKKYILSQYYEDRWTLHADTLESLFQIPFKIHCSEVFAIDKFSGYGILPYHLIKMQNKMVRAFQEGNLNMLLRVSSDFGHYIGDAHVPLHTTENYNGQLTNQVGIHAFWESRIPELFADATYDFFVGRAEYITDVQEHYWDMVLTSHNYVDSVLAIEKRLSQTFPSDKQYCFENRLDMTIRTQCTAYAQAYSDALKGQVERRFRDAILALGSAWYTAWVDAGQPDLDNFGELALTKAELKEIEKQEKLYKEGNIKGREHGE